MSLLSMSWWPGRAGGGCDGITALAGGGAPGLDNSEIMAIIILLTYGSPAHSSDAPRNILTPLTAQVRLAAARCLSC